MSADGPDRPSSLDPRYSASFQRGGDPVPEPSARPRGAQRVGNRTAPPAPVGGPPAVGRDAWSDADFQEFEAALTAEDDRAEGGDPDPAPATRYVTRWGAALTASSVAALVAAALLQNYMNTRMTYVAEVSWIWGIQGILTSVAPTLLALGIGLLVFAGYRRRLDAATGAKPGRRREDEEADA